MYDHVTLDGPGLLPDTPLREQPQRGAFHLLPGQWTDDASMGLCVADSLLSVGGLDPADMMLRFAAWWFLGYNNAFGREKREKWLGRHQHSVGLGGLISASVYAFASPYKWHRAFTAEGDQHSSGAHATACTHHHHHTHAGNGSVMRLAAIPVFYHADLPRAMAAAAAHSRTTHAGIEAAECCRLMTYIIVAAIKQEQPSSKACLDAEYLAAFSSTCASVVHLARSETEAGDADRDWNWRQPHYRYSATRAEEQPGV